MPQVLELFGASVTVPNIEKTSRFYQQFYPHDEIKRGLFAGINYIVLMRGDE